MESEIKKFYNNKSIFITGSTGFIGKVCEKYFIYIFIYDIVFMPFYCPKLCKSLFPEKKHS